ncbi:MAG: hypothetical protein A2Y62_05610 [Candidatus Fischerbacteria bacterium RBG_13_37_8]|uniref:Hydrogenase maturation factor HypA n=1 Tax=Candidatus Fischerbacteria bacterium RBG_13_37_8 TaxID=1817863 RepID=A0A1F5VXT3_9BACT|nr:MAG: hypothetical protein A2Y62_05610 [Candidatus Fischerbacteria bacterium RBG_13_37_8]
MHELSIAKRIIDKASELREEYQASKIIKIYIKIGALSGVEQENLHFCYNILIEGMDEFKESQLIIEEKEWIVKCNNCGTEYNPDVHLLLCPGCQMNSSTLISGDELDFVSLEVE